MSDQKVVEEAILAPETPKNNPPETSGKPAPNIDLSRLTQCSTQMCANGHIWAPQLGLPGCQGCHGPLLAIKMTNCPVCNEPVVKTRLRIDHIGSAHPITKVCQREYHIGPEYTFVEIDHTHTSWTLKSKDDPDAEVKTIPVGVARLAQAPQDRLSGGSASELDGCVQPISGEL